MKQEEKIEMVSEIADAILRWGNPTLNIDVEDENGDYKYSEEAQDIFNYLYDMIGIIVNEFVKESGGK